MLRIGYVRLRDPGSPDDTSRLKDFGCHVVRAEEPLDPLGDDSETLGSILDFIGQGDQLVVARLEHLGNTPHQMLEAIDRLEDRGASLQVLDPDISSLGAGGPALRAALQAVKSLNPAGFRRRPRSQPAAAEDIRALQANGLGPVEIARRLGVSRMTVWRKMKAEA